MESLLFSPRHDVLEPAAVLGVGDVAVRLAHRLLRNEPESLRALRGVVGVDFLLAIGSADQLPWVDGVTYLGRDPAAPLLLVPTQLRPNVALDVLERAVRRLAGQSGAYAVTDRPHRIIGILAAQAIERDLLEAWVKGRS